MKGCGIWDILSSSESSKIIGSTFALSLAFAGAAFLAGGLTSSPSDTLALIISLVYVVSFPAYLDRFPGEVLGAALGFAAGFALTGWKTSDSSESSPAAFFFFLMAALIAALPLGLPDLAAWMSSSNAS